MKGANFSLPAADLDFLVATAAPEAKDKTRLKQLIEKDEDFRNAFIGDEKTFKRVLADEQVFLKISPRLYFEILLRKTRKEMEIATHTIERAGSQKIAIFETKEVAELMSKQSALLYLAEMLSSFTKIESYSISYRVRKGVWRENRFNDLDIDSLLSFCDSVDEEHRLSFFKRIADICLFMLGVFPEYVQFTYRYPASGELRPQLAGRAKWHTAEYVAEGKKFYKLAAQHPAARTYGISEVFWLLHENFRTAQKPLNFIAEHYLHYRRHNLFGVEDQ